MRDKQFTQSDFDYMAFEQCDWHRGNNSEECVESWKLGYLFAMEVMGQDVGELKVEIDDYEKLANSVQTLPFYGTDYVIIEADGNFKKLGNGDIAVYGCPVDDILKEGEVGVRCFDLPEEKQKELSVEIKKKIK